MRRRHNVLDKTLGAPPVSLPHDPAVCELVVLMIWEHAAADAQGRTPDLRILHEGDGSAQSQNGKAAEAWLVEEGLLALEPESKGDVCGAPTDAGWALLRWWGWGDVQRAANPGDIGPGDFLVIREPATRRYYVVACEDRGCLRLVGPREGASSPSSAAMHARQIGGPDARVFLQEEESRHFPISRAANILLAKERLTAV